MFRQKGNNELELSIMEDFKKRWSIIIGGSNDKDIRKLANNIISNYTDDKELVEVVNDEEFNINNLLSGTNLEMKSRYKLLMQSNSRNIQEYNNVVTNEDRLSHKLIVINNIERIFDDLILMPLLVNTLLPKLRNAGISIVATINTSNLVFDKPSFLSYSEMNEYRQVFRNIPVRIALHMDTMIESELMVNSREALNLKDENKAIKNYAQYNLDNEIFDFKYEKN